MALTGDRKPLQAIAMYGWDSGAGEWSKILWAGGALAVNVDQWGGTTVTGRDISGDFQALTDDAIKGLMRSIGDAGALPANSAGNTVLKLLADILTALGGAAGMDPWAHDSGYNTAAAPFNLDLDVGQYGGSLVISVWVTKDNAAASSITVQVSTEISSQFATDTSSPRNTATRGSSRQRLRAS